MIKKCFTIIELLVTISIIAILSVISWSILKDDYTESKSNIVDIANDKILTRVYRNGELIEQGYSLDTSIYNILDIQYMDCVVILIVE